MSKNIEMNILNSDGSYESLYPKANWNNIENTPSTYAASSITGGTFATQGSTTSTYIFKAPVRFQSASGNGYISEKVNFGDGEEVYLQEAEDGKLTIHSKSGLYITTDSGGVYLNGSELGGGSSISIPVSVANGGTGQTTQTAALGNLIYNASSLASGSITTTTRIGASTGSTAGKYITMSNLLTYIQNNASSGGSGGIIEVGSYVGTGTGGESSPTSLTISTPASYVWLFGTANSSGWPGSIFSANSNFFVTSKLTTSYTEGMGLAMNSNTHYAKISSDKKTYTWYVVSGNGATQMNSSGYTYYYITF